jgi:hypothetical protein
MASLSVKDIIKVMNKKTERRKACFDKILEMCQKKIQKSVQLNMVQCFFEVPEFVLGFPLYNINECIVHVLTNLQENGFVVRYLFPRIIFISWESEAVKENKFAKDLMKLMNAPSMPPLLQHDGQQDTDVDRNVEIPVVPTKKTRGKKNARPIAEYKPSGKFVLNLT